MIAMDVELVTIVICKLGGFRVILFVEDSGNEVIRKPWNKVLKSE
jgi:hypothetical protein